MNCYNFSFKKSYTGFWRVDGNENKIPGTLYLHEHTTEIDLFCDGTDLESRIDFIKGEAFAKDENDKDVFYRFLIQGIHYKSGTRFSHGLNHYVFDVECIFIYIDGYDLKNIHSVCLRTHHLDNWVGKLVRQGYSIDANHNTGKCDLKFAPHIPVSLYHNNQSNYDINIYFGWQHKFITNDINIGTKNFINIEFGDKTLNVNEAYNEINRFKNLLYLLWNISFSPEYVEYRTSSGNCILKISDKHSYQYIESSRSLSPHTQIDDFNLDELQLVIERWIEFYEKYSDALDTYFETICNSHISPSVRIKNFTSTIDALSEEKAGIVLPIPATSKRAIFLQSVFDKTAGMLDSKDQKRLKDLILKEKSTNLKPRFRTLLDEIKDVLPNGIDYDFVEKIVNTRNNITHPKEPESFAFQQAEYKDAAYKLTQVIRAYMLKMIQVETSIIKRIIQF